MIIYDFFEIIQESNKKVKAKKLLFFIFPRNLKNFLELIQGHIWYMKQWLMPYNELRGRLNLFSMCRQQLTIWCTITIWI